jgi:hypothetical protein
MFIKSSHNNGGSCTTNCGTYTTPNSTTGRFTVSIPVVIAGIPITGTNVIYIIDANRAFMMTTVGDGGVQVGDVRTQQQSTYSGANLNSNFVLYSQSYGYQGGSIVGYGSSVFQGSGDGTGGLTINQSYDDKNGTYKVGDSNGGPISVNFDSSNPGRASFSPDGSDSVFMYFFDNNNAFFLDLSVGGNTTQLQTGWVEAQTQTTFTNDAIASTYMLRQMPPMQATQNDIVGQFALDNAGNITGAITSANAGSFSFDQSASLNYAWDTTATGTGSFLVGSGSKGLSCVVIKATKAACTINGDTSPGVLILQK